MYRRCCGEQHIELKLAAYPGPGAAGAFWALDVDDAVPIWLCGEDPVGDIPHAGLNRPACDVYDFCPPDPTDDPWVAPEDEAGLWRIRFIPRLVPHFRGVGDVPKLELRDAVPLVEQVPVLANLDEIPSVIFQLVGSPLFAGEPPFSARLSPLS